MLRAAEQPKGAAMPIRVTCACGKAYHFKDEFAGRRAKCPACGQVVQIPLFKKVFATAPQKPTKHQEPILGEQDKKESVQPAQYGVLGAPKPRSVFEGWLILPTLGMIFGPLGTMSSAGHIRIAIYELRKSGNLSHFPGAESLEAFAVTMTVLLVIVQVAAAVLYFQKRRFAPKMMVGLYGVFIAYGLILQGAIASVFHPPLNPGGPFTIVLLVGWSALWIGYFLRSNRVKATFIR
jgi:hypothetical protein